jgi:hypothetical protein
MHAPRLDTVSEARSEAFNLRLYRIGRVAGPAVRHVAVRPGRVTARRRAGFVEKRRLSEKEERSLCEPAFPRCPLRVRDLLIRAADVGRQSLGACLGFPGNGLSQRPIDLEGSGTVPPPLERCTVAARKAVSG